MIMSIGKYYLNDRITCINDEGVKNFVTEGVIYTLNSFDYKDGTLYYEIEDDEKNRHFLFATRFLKL